MDVTKEKLQSVCSSVEDVAFYWKKPLDVIYATLHRLVDLVESSKSLLSGTSRKLLFLVKIN